MNNYYEDRDSPTMTCPILTQRKVGTLIANLKEGRPGDCTAFLTSSGNFTCPASCVCDYERKVLRGLK